MTDRKKPSIPFVSFHGHSTVGSINDALGYPDEHIEYGYNNGLLGMAFTDHGNCNGHSYAFLKSQKMKKEGKTDFRVLYGIEAYVHPSIASWREQKERYAADQKLAKEIDTDEQLNTEDESETKKGIRNPLNKRGHLVLVAQNNVGLKNIFKLTTQSYTGDNFYRFPRMDFDMLKKHNEGIIATGACLTGDALVETNYGQLTLKELVEQYKEKDFYILSYDEVLKKNVYSLVSWGDMTKKNSKVLKVTLKNGKQVKLTADHKVYTDIGWIEAGDISKHPGIKILSFK